jgi:hypothetical protein
MLRELSTCQWVRSHHNLCASPQELHRAVGRLREVGRVRTIGALLDAVFPAIGRRSELNLRPQQRCRTARAAARRHVRRGSPLAFCAPILEDALPAFAQSSRHRAGAPDLLSREGAVARFLHCTGWQIFRRQSPPVGRVTAAAT